MLNIEMEKKFIVDAGREMTDCSNGHFYYEDFDIIADEWRYGSDLEALLGEDGYKTFPMTFENSIALDDENNLARLIQYVERDVHQLFRTYFLVESYEKQIEDPVALELLKEARNVSVSGASIDYKRNKVVIKNGTFASYQSIKGEKVELQQRKSVLKTVEKLAMDIYTKDLYPFLIATKEWQDMWRNLVIDLQKLENIVSKNVKSQGTLVLSALPQDLLTASINDYNWSSCFSADGCNSHMPFEYMRNMNTMIAYYIPKHARNKTFDYLGYEVSNKPWRTFVYWTENGNLSFSNAQYPTSSPEIAMNVAKIFQKEFGGEIEENSPVGRAGNQYFEGTQILLRLNEDSKDRYDCILDDYTTCVITGDYIGDMDGDTQAFRTWSELGLFYCENCDGYYSENDSSQHEISTDYGSTIMCGYCAEDLESCYFTDELIDADSTRHSVAAVYGEDYPVYVAESHTMSLIRDGYKKIKITAAGRRWGSAYRNSFELLVDPDVEQLTINLIYDAINKEINLLRPEIFFVENNEDDSWRLELTGFERYGLTIASCAEEVREYEEKLRGEN